MGWARPDGAADTDADDADPGNADPGFVPDAGIGARPDAGDTGVVPDVEDVGTVVPNKSDAALLSFTTIRPLPLLR